MDFATPQYNFQNGNSVAVARHGDDSGLYVEFFMHSVHMEAKSAEAGRPIYEDVPYIRILFPGDTTRKTERAATEDDQYRFPRHWSAFQAGNEQTTIGTPITEWPLVTKSQALEFKGINVHTVEALAAIPDSAGDRLPLGWRDLREKAKAWLSQAENGAELSRVLSENETLRSDIQMLKDQIAELAKIKSKPSKNEAA